MAVTPASPGCLSGIRVLDLTQFEDADTGKADGRYGCYGHVRLLSSGQERRSASIYRHSGASGSF